MRSPARKSGSPSMASAEITPVRVTFGKWWPLATIWVPISTCTVPAAKAPRVSWSPERRRTVSRSRIALFTPGRRRSRWWATFSVPAPTASSRSPPQDGQFLGVACSVVAVVTAEVARSLVDHQ